MVICIDQVLWTACAEQALMKMEKAAAGNSEEDGGDNQVCLFDCVDCYQYCSQ